MGVEVIHRDQDIKRMNADAVVASRVQTLRGAPLALRLQLFLPKVSRRSTSSIQKCARCGLTDERQIVFSRSISDARGGYS